jgi:multiple antibiotic resistance protein
MLKDGLLMLVIVNPFSQMVYLVDLMTRSTEREFIMIYIRATFLTTVICLLFAWAGEFLLFDVFQINLSAMRIFGGLIILAVAFSYIIHGPQGLRLFKGDITEIAQQISLPLMVGPGVLWMSVKIGETYNIGVAAIIFPMVFIANAVAVLIYFFFYKEAKGPIASGMVKYFSIAMRLNAFMMGAVAVNMVISGIAEYFNLAPHVEGVRMII